MGIDQSLSGTGIAIIQADCLNNKPILNLECKRTIGSDRKGIARLDYIAREVIRFISEFQPAPFLICMEDVTRMATSQAIIPLTELFAVIKLDVWRAGLPLRVQNQSSMKKFNFGQGNVSKDSNYMLRVFDVTQERFDDDNQADAYMHARLGVETIRLLKGFKTLSDFTVPQQEVLFAEAMKNSGLTQGKFKKLPEEEKMKLVLQNALST
jgi:Holliday junction resolvasome RuvABC endonuclease subunit